MRIIRLIELCVLTNRIMTKKRVEISTRTPYYNYERHMFVIMWYLVIIGGTSRALFVVDDVTHRYW